MQLPLVAVVLAFVYVFVVRKVFCYLSSGLSFWDVNVLGMAMYLSCSAVGSAYELPL